MPETQRPDLDPWVGKIPWTRKWQPTPAFLPGKFHGQRSLVGYSPWGRKESDTTELTCAHTHYLEALKSWFCYLSLPRLTRLLTHIGLLLNEGQVKFYETPFSDFLKKDVIICISKTDLREGTKQNRISMNRIRFYWWTLARIYCFFLHLKSSFPGQKCFIDLKVE